MTHNRTSTAGFTLVELMIASTMGAIVVAAVLSSYIFVGRNLARLASYQALENESRQALAYLSRDLTQAQSVKNTTSPTAHQLTLVLPGGEVAYTYDASAKSLRRQATFGLSRDLTLLRNPSSECTSFKFLYYTATDGPAEVPYSIKKIQVGYVVESPSTWTAETRTRFEFTSARFIVRNREPPNGN